MERENGTALVRLVLFDYFQSLLAGAVSYSEESLERLSLIAANRAE